MKKSAAAFAAFALLAPTASSAETIRLWEGSFRYTMMELYVGESREAVSSIGGVSLGETYDGYYAYAALTIDGRFSADEANSGGSDLGVVTAFRFQLPGVFGLSSAGAVFGDTEGVSAASNALRITVESGRVVSFLYGNQWDSSAVGLYGPQDDTPFPGRPNSWSMKTDDCGLGPCSWGSTFAYGTLTIEDPKRVKVSEPSVLLLLGAAAAAVGLTRRKWRHWT